MRATLLKHTLKSMYPRQRNVAIEGPPGGGKTTIVQELAEELEVPIVVKHLPTMLVEDFGILFPDDTNKLNYRLPDWFPVKGEAPEEGILLFDDRNQANSDLQKVLANICQERNLHGYDMPDGWMVISTGNRQSDRAGANRVLSHLRNRETVLELETHMDDWSAWAMDHDVKPEVVSFIRFRPGWLHNFDPQKDQNATPRSWVEGVSDMLGTIPKEAEYEAFKGAVGEGAAAEFVAFVKIYRNLPDPDLILMDPDNVDTPSDPAVLYALSGALATRASSSNFERVIQYVNRLPPEFGVLTVSMAVKRDSDLSDTNAFTKWVINNQNVLF